MLLKAIVVKVIDKYSVKIRIPRYDKIETAFLPTSNDDLSIAPICSQPGVFPIYNPGDVVIVGFENDMQSMPIVLGQLYCIKNMESESTINCDSLNVSVNSILSNNTYVKNVSLDKYIEDFIPYSNNSNSNYNYINNNLFNLALEDVDNQTYYTANGTTNNSFFGWCLTLYPGTYTIKPSLKVNGVFPYEALGSIFVIINSVPLNDSSYLTIKCDVIPNTSGTYEGAFGVPYKPVQKTFPSYEADTKTERDVILQHPDDSIAYPVIRAASTGGKYYLYTTRTYTVENLYKNFQDGDILCYRTSGPIYIPSKLTLNNASLLYFHSTHQIVSNTITVPENQIYKYYILSRYNYNNPSTSNKQQLLEFTKELFSYFNFKVEAGNTPTQYVEFIPSYQNS